MIIFAANAASGNKKPAGSVAGGPDNCCRSPKPRESAADQGFQYIRGNPESTTSIHAKVFGAGLAAHAVGLRFERKLLAFIERAQACAFDGADMNENVIAAVVGLNEAKTLCCVEPLNCSGCHS